MDALDAHTRALSIGSCPRGGGAEAESCGYTLYDRGRWCWPTPDGVVRVFPALPPHPGSACPGCINSLAVFLFLHRSREMRVRRAATPGPGVHGWQSREPLGCIAHHHIGPFYSSVTSQAAQLRQFLHLAPSTLMKGSPCPHVTPV